MRHLRRLVPALIVLALPLPLAAQTAAPAASAPAAKRALTQADWDGWRSITGATLSNDGRWAAYTLIPQVGDGELVIRSTRGATEYRVPRGFLGRPNNVPGACALRSVSTRKPSRRGRRPHRANSRPTAGLWSCVPSRVRRRSSGCRPRGDLAGARRPTPPGGPSPS